MINNFQQRPSLWARTRGGALRHVSGLAFVVTERAGRKGVAAAFTVTPDPNTLKPWQTYELATGTSFIALNKRLTQLQGEALTWHRWEREHVR